MDARDRVPGCRLRGFAVLVNGAIMAALLAFDPAGWLLPVAWVGVAWWCLAIFWLRAFDFGSAPTRRNREIKLLVGSVMVVPAWAAAWMIHREPSAGPWWTLFVLMLIWVADVSAYFAGRRFGLTSWRRGSRQARRARASTARWSAPSCSPPAPVG